MAQPIGGSKEEMPRILCRVMRVYPKKEYVKSLMLSDVEIEIIDQPEDYATYIERGVLRYIRMVESPGFLRDELDVVDVIPKGDYIMGFLGGLRRRYAGLIIEDYHHDFIADVYYIRLANLASRVRISGHFIRDYWKKFIYAPRIFPFCLTRAHDILLSDEGEEDLKEFIKNHVLSSPYLSRQEKEMVQKLITELKQPAMLGLLNDKYYVIYRCVRAFAAITLTPEDIKEISEGNTYGIVVSSACAYMDVGDAVKAYYYSGVLNYLLYKVLEYDIGVARNQYARPLAAIVVAGLQWRGEDWQADVARLSEEIHGRAQSYYDELLASGKKQVRLYLRKLYEASEEFRRLIELLDEHVDEERLRDALALVSG